MSLKGLRDVWGRLFDRGLVHGDGRMGNSEYRGDGKKGLLVNEQEELH